MSQYRTASHQPQWGQVTGQVQGPMFAGDGDFIVLPGSRLEMSNQGHLYETLGADGTTAPPMAGGVQSLMHVGHDGLGLDIGPDLSGTARTVGWGAAAVYAYARFVKKDEELQKQALPFAVGGWLASLIL